MTRVLYLLLAVVAAAAAVLSFDALLGLAVLCGFTPVLAWLLPLTVDAGAAAGTLAWLGRSRSRDRSDPDPTGPAGAARRFGRALALTLLGGSVAGNALSHGLAAYSVAPAWWVVVAVSAVPPAVLGATVHLAVLTGHRTPGPAPSDSPVQVVAESDAGVPPPGTERPFAGSLAPEGGTGDTAACTPDPVAELIASGAGRRRLARELAISEHAARELLAERRNGHEAVDA